MYKIPGA
jgi:hypothetical protein